MFSTDYYKDKIPETLLISLIDWGQKKCPTGGFLAAVLSNDLINAVGRADQNSLASLKYIILFMHNELPRECYGSPAKVKQWELEIKDHLALRADT